MPMPTASSASKTERLTCGSPTSSRGAGAGHGGAGLHPAGKLYRRPVARIYSHRYRLYLNRRDMRRKMHLVRQIRGRKFVSGPRGRALQPGGDLRAVESRVFPRTAGPAAAGVEPPGGRASMLGHFDPSHNAIIISRIFDSRPRLRWRWNT